MTISAEGMGEGVENSRVVVDLVEKAGEKAFTDATSRAKAASLKPIIVAIF